MAHEALFRAWTPLKAWLENARSELLLKQQIERDAATWRDNGRDAGYALARRTPPAGARSGRAAWSIVDRAEADVSAEFVRAGMRRRREVQRTLVATDARIIGVLAGFLGLRTRCRRSGRESEQARTLDMARVAIAGEWLPRDPTSGALVLLEVGDRGEHALRAAAALSEALDDGFARGGVSPYRPGVRRRLGPDGTRVVTVSGTRREIWDARTGRLLQTLEHRERGDDADVRSDRAVRGRRAGKVDEKRFFGGAGGARAGYGTRRSRRVQARRKPVAGRSSTLADRVSLRRRTTGSCNSGMSTGSARIRGPPGQGGHAVSARCRLVVTSSRGAVRLWSVDSGEPATAPDGREGSAAACIPPGWRVSRSRGQ